MSQSSFGGFGHMRSEVSGPFPSQDHDELVALRAWRKGDRGAGAMLFERHYASVARFFRNKVPDSVQGDLVHDTFVACLARVDELRGESKLRTFLFAVARNVLATYLRKKYSRATRIDDDADLEELSAASFGLGPLGPLVVRQEQRLLLEALRRIPLVYQTALELFYWEDLTAAEIGVVLGVPLGTAKTRLRDGRGYLERKLAELARSPEQLRSTLDDLERWAKRVRDQLGRPAVAQSPSA